ncbi:MAG TPA: protein kinase [Candidatus Acidoferrales bacterium]|nr:protein kinase [Candidatus Acidoferrales bacterium]
MLNSGTKLGPYEIQTPLGAGGMGEVYRARDARLGRDVAIKVLPEAFARDAERMARFQREAQVLASLNHPNIAAIYGFEDSGATHALVMELVEGPTLGERIASGRKGSSSGGTRADVKPASAGRATATQPIRTTPIAMDDALPIAKQIAEGLEYAHERGIVHRDLKPANIKITNSDAVKILDFGLAKALENDPAATDISTSPTISRMATQAGIILGTAAYMSPEQAKGKTVDRRADIWAFGCVLYEMLTGKMAFSGETVTDTLAAVIRAEPDWSLLPKDTPAHVRVLLQRCMQKDAKQRLRDIGDARIAIDEVLSGAAATVERQSHAAVKAPERGKQAWLPWVVAALCALVAMGLAGYLYFGREFDPGESTTLDVALPEGVSILTRDAPSVALSPDGRQIVFMGAKGSATQLYLRSLNEPDAKPIAGTENGASPFFSADGKWIGFFADGKLKKIPAEGGTAQVLADASVQRGGSWAKDGTIIFSPEYTGGLLRLRESGGQPEELVAPDTKKGERTYRWPDVLPNDKGVVFTIGMQNSAASYDEAEIAVYSFETKQIRVLTHGDMAVYSPNGYLLYYRTGVLFAAPFSESRMEITGDAVQLPEQVSGDPTSGAAYVAVATNGMMAYLSGGSATSTRTVTITDRKGESHVLPLPPRGYSIPRFSPDGKRLAMVVSDVTNFATNGRGDVWIYDFGSGSMSRLTFDGTDDYEAWSADGSKIYFDSSRGSGGGLYAKRADGTGGEQVILPNEGGSYLNPDAASPDGKVIVLTRPGGLLGDLSMTALGDKAKTTPLKTNAAGAEFSPDGKYLAYSSYQSSSYQAFVDTFPVGGGKWQISQENGAYPRWSKGGRELVYNTAGNQMMAVDVELKPTFHAGPPHVLFTLPPSEFSPMQTNPAVNYDVSADGERFVFLQTSSDGQQSSATLSVTLNLPAQIRGLMKK